MAPDLLEALRHHEPAAAECLVGAYGERAYRLAARITRMSRTPRRSCRTRSTP